MFGQTNSAAKVWFLAAPSRGFGVEMVRQLLASGNSVVAIGGDGVEALAALPEAGERLRVMAIDITDPVQIEAAVEATVARFGRIDVLVNNAAVGALGAVEEADDAEICRAVDANLMTLWRVTRAVLPVMRARRAGRIVNLSTLASAARGAGWGAFEALQAAIEALSDTLAIETGPLGIEVTTVQPVPFRADIPAGAVIVAKTQIADYYDTAGRARRRYGVMSPRSVSDPVTGVTAVITAVNAPAPPRHLALGHEEFYRTLKKLEDRRAEHMAWRDLSLAMDHML